LDVAFVRVVLCCRLLWFGACLFLGAWFVFGDDLFIVCFVLMCLVWFLFVECFFVCLYLRWAVCFCFVYLLNFCVLVTLVYSCVTDVVCVFA